MRWTTRAALVAIMCALLGALPANAQRPMGSGTVGGSLTPRISYAYLYADSGAGLQRRSWIRSIVLWRGAQDAGHGTPLNVATAFTASSAWRAARREAEDSGWTLLIGGVSNGGMRMAELRKNGTRLDVLGRSFTVPARDSMLVVMVDRADSVGGAPYVAGVAYVHASLPDRFWPRMWTHGDTLFTIHPHDQMELLATTLRTSPAVAAFMRCSRAEAGLPGCTGAAAAEP